MHGLVCARDALKQMLMDFRATRLLFVVAAAVENKEVEEVAA